MPCDAEGRCGSYQFLETLPGNGGGGGGGGGGGSSGGGGWSGFTGGPWHLQPPVYKPVWPPLFFSLDPGAWSLFWGGVTVPARPPTPPAKTPAVRAENIIGDVLHALHIALPKAIPPGFDYEVFEFTAMPSIKVQGGPTPSVQVGGFRFTSPGNAMSTCSAGFARFVCLAAPRPAQGAGAPIRQQNNPNGSGSDKSGSGVGVDYSVTITRGGHFIVSAGTAVGAAGNSFSFRYGKIMNGGSAVTESDIENFATGWCVGFSFGAGHLSYAAVYSPGVDEKSSEVGVTTGSGPSLTATFGKEKQWLRPHRSAAEPRSAAGSGRQRGLHRYTSGRSRLVWRSALDHRGTNLPAVGEYNQTVVLDAIRRRPEGITRSEIASRTALSAMTVTKVCRRLLDAGLVDEQGMRTGGPGKPAAVVKLNPSGGFAVGVHIDPAAVTYVLVDLSGAVRDHSRTGTPTAGDPSGVIEEMANAIDALIAGSGVDRSRVLGIGIASPGPVSVADGVLLNPPMLPNWRGVALRRSLAEATGLPVLLEKDTTATVVAELWFARPGSRRDFAFMYYGTGLGTGLSLTGEVVRGVSSNAGDAGHVTVDPDGPVCTCGRRGCVGYVTVPRMLVERAVLDGVLPAAEVGDLDDMVNVDAAFTRLAALATAGHSGACAILTDAARALARAIVVIVNLLDIDEVVFGGPFWARISSVVLDALPDAVRDDPALLSSHPVRFVQSAIPVDVAAVGAATLVLDNTFSPRPSALLLSAE